LIMAEETLPKKWGRLDDRKLSNLFCKGELFGGVSSTDLNAKSIHRVLKACFQAENIRTLLRCIVPKHEPGTLIKL
jgi:hypothetical protein